MHWKRNLGIILILFLLTQTCDDSAVTPACPSLWANCPDGDDFQICYNCRLTEEVEARIIRYGFIKNCRSGLGRRVAISVKCTFESR